MTDLLNNFIRGHERLIEAARQELVRLESTSPTAGFDLPKKMLVQMKLLAKLEGRLAAAKRYKEWSAWAARDRVFEKGL